MEPLNKGHFGSRTCVLYLEAVLCGRSKSLFSYVGYFCTQKWFIHRTHFSSHVITIGGITNIGAGRKNLVIAVSVTAYHERKVVMVVNQQQSCTIGKGRQSCLVCSVHVPTLLAAITDVPTTFPWSSTTSMPSLSSW